MALTHQPTKSLREAFRYLMECLIFCECGRKNIFYFMEEDFSLFECIKGKKRRNESLNQISQSEKINQLIVSLYVPLTDDHRGS